MISKFLEFHPRLYDDDGDGDDDDDGDCGGVFKKEGGIALHSKPYWGVKPSNSPY